MDGHDCVTKRPRTRLPRWNLKEEINGGAVAETNHITKPSSDYIPVLYDVHHRLLSVELSPEHRNACIVIHLFSVFVSQLHEAFHYLV